MKTRIFGPKIDKNGEWRRLHNTEFHSWYNSSNTISVITSRRVRWASHVTRLNEDRCIFKILTVKPTGKKPVGIPRCTWEDNIRVNLKEIGVNKMNSIDFEPNHRDYWRALV
jgi:hypothetical protein